ncbi:MAG TPA: hypothetical protein VFW19_07260 [Allosphingosinicella sp.]|nr:hypothetical protein [Allosphingosinicella sp.]
MLVGLARNHPFLRGNKRTGPPLAAADYFLFLSGYELAIEDGIALADLIIHVVEHRASGQDLVDLLGDHLTHG